MQLKQARTIAEELAAQMAPFCERIEIAGSIRRAVAEVKDIEICAIPKWKMRKCGGVLFAELEIEEPANLLYDWALAKSAEGSLQWIKPGVSDLRIWPPKPDGKYWRGYLTEHQIKLDLFLATPKNWGVILLIRTGSADFSHGVAAHAQRIGRNFADGHLTISGVPTETLGEETVFDLLGLEYVAPHSRFSAANVVPTDKAVIR
jgi:DNA polymerase/3'-5' exonuclease PolX